jgi:hypothetical protein
MSDKGGAMVVRHEQGHAKVPTVELASFRSHPYLDRGCSGI